MFFGCCTVTSTFKIKIIMASSKNNKDVKNTKNISDIEKSIIDKLNERGMAFQFKDGNRNNAVPENMALVSMLAAVMYIDNTDWDIDLTDEEKKLAYDPKWRAARLGVPIIPSFNNDNNKNNSQQNSSTKK